jgi:hypothetical protein
MFDDDNILFLTARTGDLSLLVITYDRDDEKMRERAVASSIFEEELRASHDITGINYPLELLPEWLKKHIKNERTRTFGDKTNVLVRAYVEDESGAKTFVELS